MAAKVPDFAGVPEHLRDVAFREWLIGEAARQGTLTLTPDGATARVVLEMPCMNPRYLGVITGVT